MSEAAIPEWAIKEALRRSQVHEDVYLTCPPVTQRLVAQLAAMIVEHEQPPVDRLTTAVREVIALWHETDAISGAATPGNELARIARCGEMDKRGDFARVRDFLASLLAEPDDG